ncbi:MAG TPA: GerW family sporulation protein [Sphingobacteriaceae bacterium]|nr:GerW family sporulation protein [Sphingobacteriaceae bacterium]
MDHPIQGLMKTAMESIKEMVDVNTVVGDAVEAKDGTVIVPVSRVSFGFAAGGGEYSSAMAQGAEGSLPFGGGSGAGVTVQPVAFLVVSSSGVRLLPVTDRALYDRLIDLAPEVLDRIGAMIQGNGVAYTSGDGDFLDDDAEDEELEFTSSPGTDGLEL